MGTTSLPRVNAQLLAAQTTIAAEPFRMLITGQIGSDGTAVSGDTYQDVESMTEDEVYGYFGTTSYLSNCIIKARSVCQAQFGIWVIALSPEAGTAASLELAFAGTATEDRTITVNPISEDQFSFTYDVETGDTGTELATAIQAKIDALDSNFPATSVDDLAGTLTLTASDVGSLGNKYTVRIDDIPAGITVNTDSTSLRVQFTSGATDPSNSGIFDSVSAYRFHTILWPWEDDYSEVEDFLEDRNTISNAFLQGVAFIGYDDTEANVSDKVNGDTPLNSMNIFFMGNRQSDSASGIIEPSDWRTVEFAAIEGLRLTDDTSIGSYVATSAILDTVGGSHTASLGYYNTPLADTQAVDPDLLFDDSEQENLTDDGYTCIGINSSATSTIMAEVVSTYKYNTRGESDNSFKYLNYIRTGFLALELFYSTLKSNNAQSRLTEGDLVAGHAIQNEDSIKAQCLSIYKLLSGTDYVLTQAGSDAETYFSDNLTVSADLEDGSVSISGLLPIVTQVRSISITFQLSYSISG